MGLGVAGTAAAIGAGGSLVGGVINSGAQQDAANTESAGAVNAAQIQANSAQQISAADIAAAQQAQQFQLGAGQQAVGLQQGIFGQTQSALAPYLNTGSAALSQLSSLLGIGGTGPNTASLESALQNYPGYQFSLQQGLQAVNQSGAARGLLNSGSTIKNATQYGQGLAQSTLGSYLSNLFSLAQGGQNAAGNLGSIGASTGSQIGSALTGAAGGAGSSLIGGTTAGGSALSQGTAGQAQSLLQAANAAGSGQAASSLSLTGGLNGALNNSLLAYQLQQQPANSFNGVNYANYTGNGNGEF